MPAKKYPLELILLAHGPAELVNADEETLWVSDSDDDFKEEFSDEFLREEDIADILDYLRDEGILTESEYNSFASDRWATTVETLENSVGDPEEDDEDEDDLEDDDEDDLTEDDEEDED
jgi:hypothetical protein